MNKVLEILRSWGIKYNPKDVHNELAAARLEICSSCEHNIYNSINIKVCGLCGCPLNAKVFSPKMKACDLNKWEPAEKKYSNILKK